MALRVFVRRASIAFTTTGVVGGAYVLGCIERTHRLVEYKTYQEPGGELVKAAPKWKVALRFVHLTFWFVPLIIFWVICQRHHVTYMIWCRFFKRMLEVTGPAFVKLGQWMAIRSDLFPKEFCDVLCDLHDNVRPHGMRHNRRVIKKNLGKPIDELFSEFDPNPVGSGSIAQVHFAKLRSTGDEVAVKICHPRVRETIAVDFYCIQLMAQLADPYCRQQRDPDPCGCGGQCGSGACDHTGAERHPAQRTGAVLQQYKHRAGGCCAGVPPVRRRGLPAVPRIQRVRHGVACRLQDSHPTAGELRQRRHPQPGPLNGW
mmetsp:Transcript_3190/g.6064  ORF Transcript_3190/g.6064 Transcript_3190/m.6064 type:complete len:316 (-) Transcript_3190:1953-2900(-)